MAKLFDRVGQVTATTGTGTITLGAVITDATNGDLATFADMGAVATDVVNYLITDGNNFEIGTGTLGGTGPGFTLTRTVSKSKISGTVGTTALTLSGTAKVYCVPALATGTFDLTGKNLYNLGFSGDIKWVNGDFQVNASSNTVFIALTFRVGQNGVGFCPNLTNTTPDSTFQYDASGVIRQSGPVAQTLRVYGTSDVSTNYARLSMKHAGGTAGATIATEAGGTATAGDLTLAPGSGFVQIGASGVSAARAAAFEQTQGTLTSGATIAWDVRARQSAILTLGINAILSNPTNAVAGTTYMLVVKQDGTGSRVLTYGTQYKWPGGTAPVLSTAANAVDVLTFVYDGTNMLGVAQKAFA